MVITEKIDGTNACIVIGELGEDGEFPFACQSRKRLITPEDDNHGFASWAYERKDELTTFLGPGRHYGEWWGKGLNRGYGMDRKVFSLFNTKRWGPGVGWDERPDGVDVVPELFRGKFDTEAIELTKSRLKLNGSYAAPGFDDPEGIVIWHEAGGYKFKSTYDKCDTYEWDGGKTWAK